tara:strand:- start:1247 stop:1432 length:186 start_codon:yes stop_codon:yes gene_type:complete
LDQSADDSQIILRKNLIEVLEIGGPNPIWGTVHGDISQFGKPARQAFESVIKNINLSQRVV